MGGGEGRSWVRMSGDRVGGGEAGGEGLEEEEGGLLNRVVGGGGEEGGELAELGWRIGGRK